MPQNKDIEKSELCKLVELLEKNGYRVIRAEEIPPSRYLETIELQVLPVFNLRRSST